jgi:hypothetical protein
MTRRVEGGNSLRQRTFIFCEVTGGARCGILMTAMVGLSFLFLPNFCIEFVSLERVRMRNFKIF